MVTCTTRVTSEREKGRENWNDITDHYIIVIRMSLKKIQFTGCCFGIYNEYIALKLICRKSGERFEP